MKYRYRIWWSSIGWCTIGACAAMVAAMEHAKQSALLVSDDKKIIREPCGMLEEYHPLNGRVERRWLWNFEEQDFEQIEY